MSTLIPGGQFKIPTFKSEAKKYSYDRGICTVIKLRDYLYEAWYSDYTWDDAEKYYTDARYAACSSISTNGLLGRNYDWYYDNVADFIVHTPHKDGRYASVGMAVLDKLLVDDVDSGKDYELYKYLPFHTLDGINECHVACNVNVTAAGDMGSTTGTNKGKPNLLTYNLIRFILDYADSVDTAIELLLNRNIISSKDWEVHFMIADPNKTVVIEFINNEMKVVEGALCMTNFYLYGFDGNTATAQYKSDDFDPETTTLTLHADGVERWDILNSKLSSIEDVEDMLECMTSVWYTNTYNTDLELFWYSEYLGENIDGDYTIETDPDNPGFLARIQYGINQFERHERDRSFWQTVHTTVYDINNLTLSVLVLEDIDSLATKTLLPYSIHIL